MSEDNAVTDPFDTMPVPALEPAFVLRVRPGPVHTVGQLATGGERTIYAAAGGTIEGKRLTGRLVSGSLMALARQDGVTTLETSWVLEAEDGTCIRMFGTGCMGKTTDFDGARMTVAFEVSEGTPHAWLATRAFIGERASGNDAIIIMQIV